MNMMLPVSNLQCLSTLKKREGDSVLAVPFVMLTWFRFQCFREKSNKNLVRGRQTNELRKARLDGRMQVCESTVLALPLQMAFCWASGQSMVEAGSKELTFSVFLSSAEILFL